MLDSYRSMSHLVDDAKGQKTSAAAGAKPTSAAGAGGAAGGGDRGAVKANLTCAIDIISNCFSNDAPKPV
jgi:hypothetical protein